MLFMQIQIQNLNVSLDKIHLFKSGVTRPHLCACLNTEEPDSFSDFVSTTRSSWYDHCKHKHTQFSSKTILLLAWIKDNQAIWKQNKTSESWESKTKILYTCRRLDFILPVFSCTIFHLTSFSLNVYILESQSLLSCEPLYTVDPDVPECPLPFMRISQSCGAWEYFVSLLPNILCCWVCWALVSAEYYTLEK